MPPATSSSPPSTPPADLQGTSILITGCTAGVGKAAAHALAARGADLFLLCRNERKGQALVDALRTKAGAKGAFELLVCDLASLDAVRATATSFLERDRPLDVLFNNAGLVVQRREETVDGFEMTFAVNHLAPYLLTRLLLPSLRRSEAPRVVATASDAHRFAGGGLHFNDLQARQGYSMFPVYGRSKLANILFTRELARREGAREGESGLIAHAYHPGFVGSDFGTNNGVLGRVAMNLLRPFARSPERGAETGVYLCTDASVGASTGGYFYDRKPHRPNAYGRDDEAACKLWELSAELVGLPA